MSVYPENEVLLRRDGLVSRWLLDEASGTRSDLIGSNDLSDENTVGSGTGLSDSEGIIAADVTYDNAADFERDNNSGAEALAIADTNQSGLDITGDITICCWVKMESQVDCSFAGKTKTVGSDDRSYILGYKDTSGTPKVEFRISSDGTSTNEATSTVNQTLTNGKWFFIYGAFDSVNQELEVGASLEDDHKTVTTAITFPDISSIYDGAADFVVGNNGNKDFAVDGLVQDCIVWNVHLNRNMIDRHLFHLWTHDRLPFHRGTSQLA